MDDDPLGFATDSSSVSTTPLLTSATARHFGPRMVVEDDDEYAEAAAVRSSGGIARDHAVNEEELPSLEDPMMTTSPGDEHSPEEWLEWYQETFSTELSLFQSKQQQQQQQQLQQQLPLNPIASTPTTPTILRTEADRLRRRMRALDALEELGARVDATSQPLSARLWEADAPQCHGCREDLGLTRLKRRHHCRFCGLTFCHSCAPGEVRTCRTCRANRTRGDALRLVRAFERQALAKADSNTAIGVSKEDVLCVARAYRSAMEAFAEFTESDLAKGLLLEGVHSFLDLDEVRACIGSRMNLSGLSLSPRS